MLPLGCLEDDVALGIEGDGPDGRPFAGLPAPAPRIAFPRCLGERVAPGEHGPILPGMALCGGDIADAAAPVLMVLPAGEAHGPAPGGLQVGKPADREVGPVFGCSKQRLSEGVVVAYPRARVGRLDAEPVQHGQHGGGLHRGWT